MSRIKRQHEASRNVRVWLFALLAGSFCTSVHALPQLERLDEDQMSVRELMRLDTQHALQQARERRTGRERIGKAPASVNTARNDEPHLAAIYGVGKHLFAEVVVDNVTYRYRQGQPLPTGAEPGDDVPMLQKISVSCVDLKDAQRSHHLCIKPAYWMGR